MASSGELKFGVRRRPWMVRTLEHLDPSSVNTVGTIMPFRLHFISGGETLGMHASPGVPRLGEHVMLEVSGDLEIFRVDDVLWVTSTRGGMIEDVFLTVSHSSGQHRPDDASNSSAATATTLP